VGVLPVDVTISGWDSTMEGDGSMAPVRLGMAVAGGMREASARRIEAARAVRQSRDMADLANRAQLDRHDLRVLAAANALRRLAGDRRQAL
jgi:error-prone DNA polymerase